MCESVLLLTIFKIVNSIIMVAKISLPLIIIVMGSVDLVKFAVSGNQDEFVKTAKSFMYRFMAAVVIFFLPTLIRAAMNTIYSYDNNNISCLFNANDEIIDIAKSKSAVKAVEYAEENQTYQNINLAKRYVNKVQSDSEKKALNTRLAAVKKALDDKQAEIEKSRISEAKKNNTKSSSSSSTEAGSGSTVKIEKTGNEIVDYALGFVGNKYVYGGPCGRSQPDLESCYASGNATDCSGFASGVYYHFGVDLRDGGGVTTHTLIKKGKAVDGIANAKPGDLIFYGSDNHHVAIYAGNNMRVHAWGKNTGVVHNGVGSDILAIRRIIE